LTRLTVALTGGIGSGKSTVSALFAQRGVAVIDADEVSHALTAPAGAALSDIAAAFGDHLIDSNGRLDRAELRGLVFNDPAARQRLEAILHPRIRAEMQQQLAEATGAYAILTIPLLFETGQHQLADRVLVIDLPEALQIERVQARSGLNEPQIRRIMASQVERSKRLAGADDIIDNSGTTTALEPQVERLHRQYLRLAPQRPPQRSSAKSGAHD
jgi:dephospho-CoA kinase